MRAARPVRTALLVVLQAALPGAEPATEPAAAGTPAESSPLERARRELESANGTGGLQGDAGLRDLKLAVPAAPIQAAPAVPSSGGRSGPPSASPQRNNWLLEAMDRKVEARRGSALPGEGRASVAETRDAAAELDGRPRSPATAAGGPRRDDPRREDSRGGVPRGEEANPFSRYLQGWVSPQDLSLLQATLASGRSTAADKSPASATGSAGGAELVGLRSGEGGPDPIAGGNLPVKTAPAAAAKPTENPFLQFLSPDPIPARAPAQAPPLPSGTAAAAPAYSPPPPVAPQRGTVPEFVRPTNDDRLYRQLKRF